MTTRKRAAKKAPRKAVAKRPAKKATARKATRKTTPASKSSRKSAPRKVTPAKKSAGGTLSTKSPTKRARTTPAAPATKRGAKGTGMFVYKLARPIGGKRYTTRLPERPVVFVMGAKLVCPGKAPVGITPLMDAKVGRNAELLCTDKVIHAYRTIGDIFKHHDDHVGRGEWAILKCEVGPEGIVADDGTKVGVRSLKPVKELAKFDSARLSQRVEYGRIKKAKTELDLMSMAKARR